MVSLLCCRERLFLLSFSYFCLFVAEGPSEEEEEDADNAERKGESDVILSDNPMDELNEKLYFRQIFEAILQTEPEGFKEIINSLPENSKEIMRFEFGIS